MEKNDKKIAKNGVSEKTLRHLLKYQQLAEVAVEKAQAENRRLGIPNWYSINGKITNDQESANGFKAKAAVGLPKKKSSKSDR